MIRLFRRNTAPVQTAMLVQMIQMMLSDLYGRIGQMLAEHGDAPIGHVAMPMFPNEPHIIADFIQPIYCDFAHVTTEMNGVKIKTYEPTIEE